MNESYRDDSDAGFDDYPSSSFRFDWNREEIGIEAANFGKSFYPNAEIAGRLDADLNQGALVLFTPAEVDAAISEGLVPESEREALTYLVSKNGDNDIAVIPANILAAWRGQQE